MPRSKLNRIGAMVTARVLVLLAATLVTSAGAATGRPTKEADG